LINLVSLISFKIISLEKKYLLFHILDIDQEQEVCRDQLFISEFNQENLLILVSISLNYLKLTLQLTLFSIILFHQFE